MPCHPLSRKISRKTKKNEKGQALFKKRKRTGTFPHRTLAGVCRGGCNVRWWVGVARAPSPDARFGYPWPPLAPRELRFRPPGCARSLGRLSRHGQPGPGIPFSKCIPRHVPRKSVPRKRTGTFPGVPFPPRKRTGTFPGVPFRKRTGTFPRFSPKKDRHFSRRPIPKKDRHFSRSFPAFPHRTLAGVCRGGCNVRWWVGVARAPSPDARFGYPWPPLAPRELRFRPPGCARSLGRLSGHGQPGPGIPFSKCIPRHAASPARAACHPGRPASTLICADEATTPRRPYAIGRPASPAGPGMARRTLR